jgi:copper(I)-binding protein
MAVSLGDRAAEPGPRARDILRDGKQRAAMAYSRQPKREQSAGSTCLRIVMTTDAHPTGIGRHFRVALCCGVALALLAPNVGALMVVNQPWLLPAARGQSTEVYMNLTSTDGATLVAVRTEEAARVAIVGTDKPTSEVGCLPLPAGTVVALAPGKYRLALTKLGHRVKLGDLVALTLTIEATDGTRQEIPVLAEARRRSPLDEEKRAHHTHAH